MLSTTVMVWPPGFTVSCPSRATRLVEVTVTVTLFPAASVPADGDTLSLPTSAGPTVIEYALTGPPSAVSVSFPDALPSTVTRSSVPGDAVTMPWLTAGVADELADGEEAADGVDTVVATAELDASGAPGDCGEVAPPDLEDEAADEGATPLPLTTAGPPRAEDGPPRAEEERPVLAGAAWDVPSPDEGLCGTPPMTTTAMAPAATTDVAALATAVDGSRVRCHGEAHGALTGLGKPAGPNRPARFATLSRCAIPAGVWSAMVLSS
jgi:hypothetical protein